MTALKTPESYLKNHRNRDVMKKVDLHVHTNKSDGTFSPEEAVDYACTLGLSAIAITDHDTVLGIQPAMVRGDKYGIEIIPGIEISAEWVENGVELEVHMLGYFIDHRNSGFQKRLYELSNLRMKRAEIILGKLRGHNIKIDMDELKEFLQPSESGTPWVGRLHIAQAMVKKGCVKSINRAFDQYIGNGKCCYVPKHQLTPEGAVQMIKEMKGLAVIAHPGLLNQEFSASLIRRLVKNGLDGIEIYYPEHSPTTIRNMEMLAAENSILATGGTDCHGFAKGNILMGTLDVPYELLEKMKERHSRAQGG
ncbi:phosphatase [Candidatus Desantisbacteria bacterium CG_4_10_14_0_8_um_filter_48_22]|uniref:Phosphatase n=1 Tax=Candidatus Desantisbacteria bacterium CG_4_10_14_0_8_um_filter_48_22 TaxID=1974543 RepID=A0A2M7SEX1_9BACT|nr:MAG: phosphatase [Candidatus Desantisbacteria bacterium CG_4_10_14_0_8_um_filter_48_22]